MDEAQGSSTLAALVSRTLGVPRSHVTDQLGFGTIPEWDSLNHVQLMLALEAAYGVEIDEDHMITLTNLQRIRVFVAANAAASAGEGAA